MTWTKQIRETKVHVLVLSIPCSPGPVWSHKGTNRGERGMRKREKVEPTACHEGFQEIKAVIFCGASEVAKVCVVYKY